MTTTRNDESSGLGLDHEREPRFSSPDEVGAALAAHRYLADPAIASVVFLADRLVKPVLIEGPAGTGKTQLGKTVAEALGARLLRLQCYEGLDESKALYEWNYRKQLLRIQAGQAGSDRATDWHELESDIFSDEFLLTRPLLEAIRATEPVVLLIDEVDRIEVETEALLLEVLSEYQVSVPELGTVTATQVPLVFLTSNNTRELSEALKRRCLYLHIGYPDVERERAIVLSRVPGVSAALATRIAEVVRSLRELDLRKAPSVSETLDWARTLVVLGRTEIGDAELADTLHVLLKYQSDIDKASKELLGNLSLMLDVLGAFVGELRAAGIPVSTTEHLDAARALVAIDLMERDVLKAALATTMVKDEAHMAVFDAAFEIFFATVRVPVDADGDDDGTAGERAAREGDGARGEGGRRAGQGRGGGASDDVDPEQLAAMLLRAMREGDHAALAEGARMAVSKYAGIEPGRPVGGTYYLYRTLRNLDLDRLQRLLEASAAGEGAVVPGSLAARLARDDASVRIDQLKRAVEAEIRQRLVEDRGAAALARSVRRPLPEDLDVMHATRDELAALHRALVPLSRKLAVRLARKRRRGHRGALDLRRTVRNSMSTGGVPITPIFKPPRPAKPEIFVIADVSGSVASFARFTLLLVHAISSQFRKVRSFVFVDGLDEATRFFEATDDPTEAVTRINTEADVVWIDGHSDYGRAFTLFHERHAKDVSRRTSVLVLGDARNNYHASQAWVLEDLRARARAVYWLNPEPRGYWNSGDSIVSAYAPYCDAVVECRTLRQLEAFVGTLA